ncbi:BadF/BadG/BcrA/BcrD ATPase family protein [Yoonia sp. 2307UL14-13]|uniref:BadF/BadG/BcrA/BcrD ATPase family protein n=1 Tax=Yoonia sp. 2307UL14-13 TaxID=3126506 RepID=UPI003094DBC5
MSDVTAHWIMGIDGGGTGCRVAIARPDGVIIAHGEGGPANFTSDPDGTITHIRNAMDQAAKAAGLGPDELARCAAHAGLAGVQRAEHAMTVAEALPLMHCTVTEDRVTAIAGALGEDDGVLLSVGTGTFVGVKRGQQTRFLGGWGFRLSDQASGAWLGRRLLETVLLVHDGLVDPSDLSTEVMDGFSHDPTEIVAFAAQATPADYATFAPRIVQAAEADDDHGLRLMHEGADFLQRCISLTTWNESVLICFSEGLGGFYKRYVDKRWKPQITSPKGTPLDGALELARKSLDETGIAQ